MDFLISPWNSGYPKHLRLKAWKRQFSSGSSSVILNLTVKEVMIDAWISSSSDHSDSLSISWIAILSNNSSLCLLCAFFHPQIYWGINNLFITLAIIFTKDMFMAPLNFRFRDSNVLSSAEFINSFWVIFPFSFFHSFCSFIWSWQWLHWTRIIWILVFFWYLMNFSLFWYYSFYCNCNEIEIKLNLKY